MSTDVIFSSKPYRNNWLSQFGLYRLVLMRNPVLMDLYLIFFSNEISPRYESATNEKQQYKSEGRMRAHFVTIIAVIAVLSIIVSNCAIDWVQQLRNNHFFRRSLFSSISKVILRPTTMTRTGWHHFWVKWMQPREMVRTCLGINWPRCSIRTNKLVSIETTIASTTWAQRQWIWFRITNYRRLPIRATIP